MMELQTGGGGCVLTSEDKQQWVLIMSCVHEQEGEGW